MINIDELRQRVEAAEQRFGMVDSAQRQSTEKLIKMMNAIEQDQAQKQTALEESKVLVASMAIENQQLRSMLHSLLLATESAGNVANVEIMRQIDSKLSAIVESTAPAAAEDSEAAPEASPPVPEPFEDMAVAAEPEAAEPEAVEPEVEVGEPEAVLESAPADAPIDDDILPEPPGMLPSAVIDTDSVAPMAMDESAPEMAAPGGGETTGDDIANGETASAEASNGAAAPGNSKIDAVEAANGVREILMRMNKEKRQQEAATRSQS